MNETTARIAWWIRMSGERRPGTRKEVGTSQNVIMPQRIAPKSLASSLPFMILPIAVPGLPFNHHPTEPTPDTNAINGSATHVCARYPGLVFSKGSFERLNADWRTSWDERHTTPAWKATFNTRDDAQEGRIREEVDGML